MALLLVFRHVFTSFSSLFLQFIQNTLNRGIKWQQVATKKPLIATHNITIYQQFTSKRGNSGIKNEKKYSYMQYIFYFFSIASKMIFAIFSAPLAFG